jgi:hypothetical protein
MTFIVLHEETRSTKKHKARKEKRVFIAGRFEKGPRICNLEVNQIRRVFLVRYLKDVILLNSCLFLFCEKMDCYHRAVATAND